MGEPSNPSDMEKFMAFIKANADEVKEGLNSLNKKLDQQASEINNKFVEQATHINEVGQQAKSALDKIDSLTERIDAKEKKDKEDQDMTDGPGQDGKRKGSPTRGSQPPTHGKPTGNFGPWPNGAWVPQTPSPPPAAAPSGQPARGSNDPAPSNPTNKSDDNFKAGTGCKIWFKGFGQPCRKEDLEMTANNIITKVNQESMSDYSPTVKGFDLNQAIFAIFKSKKEADDFIKTYSNMTKVTWNNPEKIDMEIRVVKDATFDERLRRQVLWLIKDGLKRSITTNSKWPHWPEEKMSIADNGIRGEIFIKDEITITSIMKITLANYGCGNFAIFHKEALQKFNITIEQAQNIVDTATAAAPLLAKKI
jgi:hypothetical protein